MSRLTPALMPLDKGLNLQTPKILAPEGSVLESLNYEQVDFQGQKRIDGYARYDGTVLSAFSDFAVVPNEDYTIPEGDRDLAFNGDGVMFGLLLEVVGGNGHFAVINEQALPDSYQWGVTVIESPEDHYTLILGYQSQVRALVETLPGAVIGLHWFRDRLYAVADLRILLIEGDEDVLPNDILTFASVDFLALGVVKDENFTYVLSNTALSPTTVTVERTAETLAVASVTAGYKASFFESRTDQQVLTEDGPAGPYDFGWRFNHLGWAVPFHEGNSPFGDLVSLNQNRQGVGVQGPTSISGDSGKPIILTQRVTITNRVAQVNGWKTSTSPNVYNLEAEALNTVDNYTIYADAYFSWDGETGTVTAQGISGDPLVEYPATNTVVVDI